MKMWHLLYFARWAHVFVAAVHETRNISELCIYKGLIYLPCYFILLCIYITGKCVAAHIFQSAFLDTVKKQVPLFFFHSYTNLLSEKNYFQCLFNCSSLKEMTTKRFIV